MIKKRLLSMLVLLAAVVTGAWAADELYLVVDGTSATLKYDSNKGADDPYLSTGTLGNTWQNAETARSTATTITVDATCKNFEGTSLNALFYNFTALTSINNLENLNMANVTKISGMFRQCSSLTAIDVSSFNTAQVTDMNFLFMGCTSLTTLDLSNFNTASVEKMTQMFDGCSLLENIYVGDGWNTDAVTASNNMFRSCSKLPNYASSKVDKTNAHTGEGGYLKLKPATTYKVTLQEGTEDVSNWQAKAGEGAYQSLPLEGVAAGTAVTITYNGSKRVKNVTAVKKAAAPAVPDGAISGQFTINSSGDKVFFSKGNLQYTKSTGKWSFMEHQYDIVETLNQNVGDNYANQNVVSLFGWGTKSNPTKTSTNNNDYGSFTDWGTAAASSIGSGWRTLTGGSGGEWEWIIGPKEGANPGTNCRTSNATVNGVANARYTHATINTDGTAVNGIILFPDGCKIFSTSATSWGNINSASTWDNATKCKTAEWQHLEDLGCVFLPAAGFRYVTSVSYVGSNGYYWSSTANGTDNAYNVLFYSNNVNPAGYGSRLTGFSVRLVREVTE